MKTSQHPVWKRFVSMLLVVLMLMPSVGMTAAAEELPEEELVLAEELPEEHEHRDDDAPVPEAEILIEEAAAEEAVVTDEWLEEEALPAAELPEVPEAAPEAEALESEEIALETEREGDPGTVRILAADGVFPAGAVLCVTNAEVPALQAGETLSFESGGEPEEKDEIICDEEIPDGDEILVVNPRRADADAQYSVTREVVASYCYEIHMSGDDGEVLQPAEGQSVTLAFDLPEAADESLDVRVLHYPADGAAEELPARVEDGTVYAETTGFSAFVIEFTRTDRRYTVTSSVPEAVKNIVDNVVTEEKNLYVVYASSSNPNLVKTYKDMGIWFVEVPWSFNETVTLTVGTSPNQGDVSATAKYEIKISVHQPAISYKKLGKTEECIKYTLMSSISERMGMTLKDGWYVVDKNVTFEKNRLTVLGDVHLILRDGCTLTCKYGIRTATQVDPNTSLSIYAEDRGTGLLHCEVNYDRRTTESFYAGIGGNRDEDGCKITVYGGEVKAVGAIQGAAIGGGTGGSLLGFTMYDGTVTVKGKKGAGVGGGKDGTIKGPIAIHGGLLTAQSLSDDYQDPINYSAAVGAGEGRNLGADIIIDGGVVIAHAHNGGPGIGDCGITSGGRRTDDNGAVYIKGGHVMASGVDGAGIGAGLNGIERGGTGCTVNISGGFVEAVSSGRGAGIGGSYKGNGGTVNISGGYVIARGKDVEVPFGHGHKWLTVEKQNSAARAGLEFIGNLLIEALTRKQYGGAGIGGGDSGNGGTVTISGGTILAAGGRTECKAIGQGMQGESKGTASITNDNLRIQYGWDMNKLVETTRKDGDKWHNITREQRSKLLTFDSIVYISPCTHVDMPYRSLNANYHERVCNTCLYYEHAEPHDFDDKGICRKCLYNRNDKPVEYNVWYLGTRITSENMERLHYDPFTNTLTIPEKVDGRLWGSLKNGALIYAEGDLNISGNAWVSPQDNPAEYGVYVKGGTLTFKEDSSLSFLASKYGVYAPDGLKIEKVKELSFYTRDGGTGAYFGDKPPVVHEEVAMKTPEYGKAGSGAIVDKDGKTAKDVCFVQGLTLRFDADGAVGTPEPMKGLVKNREYTLPEGKPRRQNFDFLDWNINGNLYAEGMQFSISGDATAKAVWQAHAHTWKAPVWEWKKDDSGRWLATAMFVCSECNELKQVAASVFTNTVPARCEKAGSITYLASVRAFGGENGEYNDSRSETLPAIGHRWGEWKLTTEATTEHAGEKTRVCLNDKSHVETEIIARLHSHSMVRVARKEPVCVIPGHIEYWRCAGCGRLFADEKGEHEITQSAAVLPARGHTPESEWTLAGGRAPSCESDGVNSFEQHCAVCGAVIATRTERVAALGHAWGAWSVTRAATETAEGIETRTCVRCGSTQEHSIPRLEHRHSMTKIDAVEPSCTEGGSMACYRCSACGKLYADAAGKTELYESDIYLPANGHRAESSWRADAVTKEPGCTDQGFMRMKLYCADCGAELSSRGEPIAPVGHSWEAWETTLEPTETQEGKQIRVCHNDPEKHVEERSIPVLQHTHTMTAVPAKAAGCTEPGNSAYYRCTGCGHYFADAEGTKPVEPEDMLTDPLGHSAGEWSEGKVEKTAKCTETGIRSYTLFCARCGEALTTRTERIPALGHAWGEWKTLTPATEEAEGTEIRTCAHDGEHTETRTTPRLAHTHRMKEVPAAAPTCLEPGSIAYYACTGCGRLFADAEGKTELSPESITLPPKGHAAAEAWTSEELAPTCTAPGYTRLTLHCADCGEVLSTRGMAIPATGHSWGAWETVKEATELDDGLERRICAHDPAHIQTREIPALGHTHKMTPVAEKAPTCTEAGNRAYYRCTGCGLCFLDAEGNTWISDEDTVLAPLGHRAGAWKEESSTAPGCTEPGVKNFALRCTACGAVLTERSELIPAAGHDWGEASYRWSDDCSVVIAERRCRNDGTHIQQERSDKIKITTPIPADCEEEGVRLYRAVFENPAFVSEKTQTIPAIGHDWGDWEITTPATETEDGEQTRICRNDASHVQTSVIPRLTHVHRLSAVPAKEPTCTEEGNKACWICDQGDYPCEGVFTDAEGKNTVAEEDFGTLFLAPLGHSWKLDSVEWTDDLRSALFFFTCLRDGSHTREVLGEVLEEPVLTPPTETEDGKLSYTATAVLDGESYRATKDVVVRREPAFKTHSLILSGEIGVHFYMDLPALEGVDYSESYMSFRVKDMEKRVDFDPNRKNDAGTYYCFTCYVPSIMMAQPITATFHYGEDQTVEQTYTIMEYIQAFEKRSGDFPAATQRVVEALADFGHYIQPFLSDVRGWKIGTDYSEMTEHFKEPYSEAEIAAVSEAVADRAIVRDPGDSQIRKVSYNLVLDSETAIRVYLKPKSGYEGEVTATLDGGAENVAEAQSDGRYLVTIPNISAHQLGDTHIIRVTAGSSFTVEVSALSYIQSILSSDQYKADQNARNAMAALYEYYCAVTAAKEGGVRK